MSQHRAGSGKGCSLEALEQRRLLSGNVTVSVDPATQMTHIVGDNKSNQINIEATLGSGGPLLLVGENGTTVNGGSSVSLFPLLQPNIKIDMGNGEDSVKFSVVAPVASVLVTGASWSIDTGNGDDSVSFVGWSVSGGSVSINTGNGGDSVHIENGTFDSLSVDLGNGPDSISFAGTVTAGNATLDGGNGPDSISGIASLNVLGTESIIDIETIG